MAAADEDSSAETVQSLVDDGCGRQIGRYTLLRKLASGGMAEVWLARGEGASGFAKRFALKRILPQHAHNERFVEMLVDEAKITVRLTHPNVAQVFELGQEGESFFIVMEYVPGPPLHRMLREAMERHGEPKLPVSHAVHVMAEVARGLEHAHASTDGQGRNLGIVHRDVSPQNIMVSWGGDVKLIDFGIARAENRLNQTQHGVIKGKLRYLAPEIARGLEPDARADVYCCGIVLFETLTGQALFNPRSDFEAIEMATRGRARSVREDDPSLPVELEAIVARALAPEREDRYPAARELQDDLRRFLNRYDPSFVESDLATWMQTHFAHEAQRSRALDELAETTAERGRRPSAPTLIAPPAAEYRRLVTSVIERPPGTNSETEANVATQTTSARRPSGVGTVALSAVVVLLAGIVAFLLARPRSEAPGVAENERPMTVETALSPDAPASEPEAREPARPTPPPRSTPPSPSSAQPMDGAPSAPSAPRPRRRRPRAAGTLVVNARPASTVYLGKRRLGRTPVRAQVPIGRHRVTLVAPDGRRKVLSSVVRKAGESQLIYRWP